MAILIHDLAARAPDGPERPTRMFVHLRVCPGLRRAASPCTSAPCADESEFQKTERVSGSIAVGRVSGSQAQASAGGGGSGFPLNTGLRGTFVRIMGKHLCGNLMENADHPSE